MCVVCSGESFVYLSYGVECSFFHGFADDPGAEDALYAPHNVKLSCCAQIRGESQNGQLRSILGYHPSTNIYICLYVYHCCERERERKRISWMQCISKVKQQQSGHHILEKY